MQKQVRKLEQIPEHLPANRYFITPATYTTLICSTLMYETLAWSGSSTLSPICFAFKWASLLLRFYFSQALSPVVSAAVIYSLKSALHQSERNLHIPGLLKFLSSFRKANSTNTKQAQKSKQSKTKQNKTKNTHTKNPVSCWFWDTATLLWALQHFFDCSSTASSCTHMRDYLSLLFLCYPCFCLSLVLLSLLSSALSLSCQATFSSCFWVSDLSHLLHALCYHISSLDLCCLAAMPFLCCFCAAANQIKLNQNNNNKNHLPTNLPWKYLLAALCALTSFHWASASWHDWHLIVTEHYPDSMHTVFLMFLLAHKCCKLFNIKHKLAEGKCCCFNIYCSFFCCPAYGKITPPVEKHTAGVGKLHILMIFYFSGSSNLTTQWDHVWFAELFG